MFFLLRENHCVFLMGPADLFLMPLANRYRYRYSTMALFRVLAQNLLRGGRRQARRVPLSCKIADLGDNSQTEGKLEVGKPGQGKLTGGGANNDSDDSDSFAVFLEASAQYRISVNATILINPKPIEGVRKELL
jgi:hypothetical protein